MKIELDKKLEDYAKSDMYPFHMPGHKRKRMEFLNPYAVDITEIEGFDNLGHSKGILLEAQQRAAELYGSRQTYYLVNGSTCGILSGISAAVKKGDKVLMSRNAHKAVYHAAYLNQLKAEYIYPAVTEFGIQGAVSPAQVEKMLKENKDTAAVVITSPTYEGIVSDIKTIAEIVHKIQIPLIVDEAHGAHFGLGKGFPESAVRLGADIVIQSMHKVLPSFTQTALLHLNSNLVNKDRVEQFLGIYQTSSPSYVLMAGMEKCIRLLREEKDTLFRDYRRRLRQFWERTSELKHIRVLMGEELKNFEYYQLDPSKIIISVKTTNMSGKQLYEILLSRYHLQMEMVSGFYVLAMTSIMDDDAGFLRLMKALLEIDQRLVTEDNKDMNQEFMQNLYGSRTKVLEIAEAMDLPPVAVNFLDAEGKTAGSFIYLYPPGIPVIVPGEKITKEFLTELKKCLKAGLCVEGDSGIRNQRINVVNF